ncbi:hypothetical protein AVEN_119298-2, partial [Araneus ventricosus]
VPKKKRSKKVTRKKTNMCSRSNVLKKIKDSLDKEDFRHMLYWDDDKMKNEFIVKFVHMNNPEWKNADYLELFKELDKLSNNYKKYLQDEKYNHKCKIRCKANLRKLVESGALTFMGKTCKGKSIQLRKYKLNFDVSSAKRAVSEGGKMTKRCNVINIYVNIPVGGSSISSASPIGPPLLYTCCTTENRNEDVRNVILQKHPLTEHEKQMDGNDDAFHAMSIEDPALCTSSISCSSIEENDKCGLMGCCKLLDQNIQGTVEIENNGALPTNCTESLNMEPIGKFTFPYCTSRVEEAMGAINLAGTHYTSSEYNELLCSNNSPNRLQ